MNGLLTLPLWHGNGGGLIYYIVCLWKRFGIFRGTIFSLFLIKFVPLYSNLDGLNVIRKISWILVILFYIFRSFAILCLLLFHCNVFLFIFPNLRDLSISFLPHFVSHPCSHTNAHSLLSHQLKEIRILWRKLAIQQTDEMLIEFYISYPFFTSVIHFALKGFCLFEWGDWFPSYYCLNRIKFDFFEFHRCTHVKLIIYTNCA